MADILNDHILQAFRSIIKKVKKIREVVRPDTERAGRAAETAATDLVIRGRPLDIEQVASPPQDLQEFFPFLAGEAFHHGISLVCDTLLQKLFVLHKFFQEIELSSGVERQEFQLLHKLDRTFPRTEEQIYKVAVEIVVDVHAADLRLHAEQERATSAERLQVQFWSWREHLPDVRDQLFLAADPGDKRSSDPGHLRPASRRNFPLPAPSRKLPHPDRRASP